MTASRADLPSELPFSKVVSAVFGWPGLLASTLCERVWSVIRTLSANGKVLFAQ